MKSTLQDPHRSQDFPEEVNERGGTRVLIAILPVVAGLVFLGSFRWNSEPESRARTAQKSVPSVAQSSIAAIPAAPTAVKPATTSPLAIQRVRLAVTPSGATYPLGERNSLSVKMATAPALSRGVVTLVYDPEIIEVTNVHPFAADTPYTVSSHIENLQGWVSVKLEPTGAGSESESEGGLFTVEFKPIAEGRSDMVLTEAKFTDDQGLAVPVEVNNGDITVAVRQ